MTAQRDLRSDLNYVLAFSNPIDTNTTTVSSYILDTVDYDNGIVFYFIAPLLDDGIYTPKLEHSDDSGMAGAEIIPSENIIGSEANAVITTFTVPGGNIPTLGIVGVKRYVRVSIISTGIVGTGAIVHVGATRKPEILPAIEPDA